MRRFLPILLLSALTASCMSQAQKPASLEENPEAGEMNENAIERSTDVLHVPAEDAQAERMEFREHLEKSGRTTKGKRELYARYISVIGANGILEEMQDLWPKCHSEGHAAGALIESKLRNVGTSLAVCADSCYSGCMHGVLMEAFKQTKSTDEEDEHIEIANVKELMDDICFETSAMTDSYSPGDCAHGVGHALMFLAEYGVDQAIDYCKGFSEDNMKYYCATGAYMEYVSEKDREDAPTKSPLYPCDENDYPAACARYKFVHLANRYYKVRKDPGILIQLCTLFKGKYRIGCYHGLGNAHMSPIYAKKISIKDVCLTGNEEENESCIEGAMERMAKYHPERAEEVCEELSGDAKDVCERSLRHGMYNMEKDMSLYLRSR